MIGFAVMSYKENGVGGLVSQGLGTSMLQMGNIVKEPPYLDRTHAGQCHHRPAGYLRVPL